MIGNALGYSAVTCMVLLAGACGGESGTRRETPAAPATADYGVIQPPREEETNVEPVQLPPESPEASRKSSGPAVVALLDRADQESKSQKPDQAIATLERALKIEPRNPHLYRQLAILRLAQGQAEQAESLALKSNSLANGDRQLQARNWRLVAESRRVRQDAYGAAEAERRAHAVLAPH